MNRSNLEKSLGFKEVFSISAGAMISSGLFVLPAVVFAKAGPSIVLAYILAACFAVPAMLSKAELATAMPKSGGVYFYITRSFGPLFGLFSGLAAWFSLSLKSAFALIGVGVFLVPLFSSVSPYTIKLIAVTCTVLFAIVNLLSVKGTGRLQVVLVVILLGSLLFFVARGIGEVDLARFAGTGEIGVFKILSVTGLIFVSFGGLTKVASVAEEVRNPGKSIPRGMFSAFAVVALLYVGVVFTAIGVLSDAEFAGTQTPISLAASKVSGSVGYYVLTASAMIAFVTTANAGLMAASRNPLAMARDNLLPKRLAHIHPRLRTPVLSIVITSVFMIACIVLLDIESLVKVASTMKLLLFALVNISVIFMRQSGIVTYKPLYKAPLYPYLQIAGTAVYLFLIVQMGAVPLLITAGFFGVSILWYFIFAKKHVRTDSAFVRMVGTIADRELVANDQTLEGELLDILRERDEIREDRFDSIIRKSIVLDLDRTVTRDEFFRLAAEAISGRWDVDLASVQAKLSEREQHASTLIYPGVAVPHAIPHIIIEGSNLFDIVLARNKFGIEWNEQGDVVYTVFCMIGSKDERNFHLKALMSIAQVLQDPDFHRQWTKARTAEELKSAILVAKRRRE